MNSTLKNRTIPLSPPDITEMEAEEVKQAILSGWITTGHIRNHSILLMI